MAVTNFIAALIVRNEADRYLEFSIPPLVEMCDLVCVVDDASTDETHDIVSKMGAKVKRNDRPMFFEHEGRARNDLLDWVLGHDPSHLLMIDADEIIGDTRVVRRAVEQNTSLSGVWNLEMEEVWQADEQFLYERVDGQWGSRKVPIVFEVPARMPGNWRIANRALACGREPMPVAKAAMRGRAPVVGSVFHLGWSCESDRAERYERYVKHDGGQFHANSHLLSIMDPDEKVGLNQRPWPAGMLKPGLLDRINR